MVAKARRAGSGTGQCRWVVTRLEWAGSGCMGRRDGGWVGVGRVCTQTGVGVYGEEWDDWVVDCGWKEEEPRPDYHNQQPTFDARGSDLPAQVGF